MKNRRMRPIAEMDSGTWLKTGNKVYLAASLTILTATAILFIFSDLQSLKKSGSFFAFIIDYTPILLWISCLLGMGLLFLTNNKCAECILGPGKRLTSAMEKMGKGDLGWKLTLRRGDEMREVADSVSKASQALAERIGKMQSEIRGIAEVEEYLIDSVSAARSPNPYFMKALRKLKISTTRLKTDINDFHVSITESPQPLSPSSTVISKIHRAQSIGGQ